MSTPPSHRPLRRPAVSVVPSLLEIPREQWNAMVGDGSPFLEWGWLATLEEAGCLGAARGWVPQHLVLRDGDEIVAACPTYLKYHSQGEFVFDHSWASACENAGIRYFPKLLVAPPFTPAAGRRFLVAPGRDPGVATRLLGGVLRDVCERQGISSAHVNFCLEEEAAALRELGFVERAGFQFQWRNRGYATFDDFLGAMRHKRRKEIKRERREPETQGIVIEKHVGEAIPRELYGPMYELYLTTVDKYVWGKRYLDERFFELLPDRFAKNLVFFTARRRDGGGLVAGTFCVQKSGVLYGRYWGCFEELRHLHFNVCYYAAIEHCIEAGLERFEPGAGGEFKFLRGFDPEPTRSMHFLADPRLADAVTRFCAAERRALDDEMLAMRQQSALRAVAEAARGEGPATPEA